VEFITNDNYEIREGSRIYYTGDVANIEGNFIVAKIEPCNWYKFKIILKEEEGGKNRTFTLTPTNFNSGPGRRFKPAELVSRERTEAYEKIRSKNNY